MKVSMAKLLAIDNLPSMVTTRMKRSSIMAKPIAAGHEEVPSGADR